MLKRERKSCPSWIYKKSTDYSLHTNVIHLMLISKWWRIGSWIWCLRRLFVAIKKQPYRFWSIAGRSASFETSNPSHYSSLFVIRFPITKEGKRFFPFSRWYTRATIINHMTKIGTLDRFDDLEKKQKTIYSIFR